VIEKELLTYLQKTTIPSCKALTTKLGGIGKIFVLQVPTTDTTTKMPWLIIEPTGGTRTKISASKVEEVNNVRISVDCGPAQMVLGRESADLAKKAVENYRGTIGGATDIIVTCSAVSGWPGLNGCYRWQFTARCQWTETCSEP
jgi:hypothetical protein